MIFISTQMLMMHANDLLDSRFIEQGHFSPTLSAVDVYEAIQEMVQLVKFNQAHRQVKLIFDKPKIPTLSMDRRRLQQVVLSLISNVCKFSKEGLVKIKAKLSTVRKDESYLTVTVGDQGVGYTDEEVQLIFNP